jgi:hypothetical protein
VFRRLSITGALILGILATGVQWDALQVFAWGRMIAVHSQEMSLSAAVNRTFHGEMCGICRAVAAAESQEQKQSDIPDSGPQGKILLFLQVSPRLTVAAPPRVDWEVAPSSFPENLEFAPPVPPPRQAVA